MTASLSFCWQGWCESMIKINEVIVVEGVYDKNALRQVVDATVIDIGGFGIFKNSELRELLRRLAQERGVIILTDSDAAGFVIRNHLKGALPPDRVKHAYIPDVYGKERRKAKAGREGKLGVEGMPPDILLGALVRAGAAMGESDGSSAPTSADFYEWGLSGGEDSSARRDELKARLGLPSRLSSRAFFGVLAALYGREELDKIVNINRQSLPLMVSPESEQNNKT